MLRDLDIEVLSLQSFPGVPEIEEDGLTFDENALKKAREVSRHTSQTVLADDSGLEVDILGGEPGIHSARYSGPTATDASNNLKLLRNLEGVPKGKRGAAFRCALVLYRPDGRSKSFEGFWRGMTRSFSTRSRASRQRSSLPMSRTASATGEERLPNSGNGSKRIEVRKIRSQEVWRIKKQVMFRELIQTSQLHNFCQWKRGVAQSGSAHALGA
jgi:non-canonical purine NTP pyrophosphatase (RdgB/HAM1 family)